MNTDTYTPSYFVNTIKWDYTLNLSDKTYHINLFNNKRETTGNKHEFFTAKEWIGFEIYLCKKLVEENERLIKKEKKKLEKQIRETKRVNCYFNKYIMLDDTQEQREKNEDFFFYAIRIPVDDFLNHIKKTKFIIEDYLNYLNKRLQSFEKETTKLKAICRESIKYILKKEKIKNFAIYADHIMDMNNIPISKNIPKPEEVFNKTNKIVRLK